MQALQVLELLLLQDEKTGLKSGTDRQNGFIVVWERIVDEEGLECVMDSFTEKDIQRLRKTILSNPNPALTRTLTLRKRVGTLNMFNPFACDGPHCLDFRCLPQTEHREGQALVYVRIQRCQVGHTIYGIA